MSKQAAGRMEILSLLAQIFGIRCVRALLAKAGFTLAENAGKCGKAALKWILIENMCLNKYLPTLWIECDNFH